MGFRWGQTMPLRPGCFLRLPVRIISLVCIFLPLAVAEPAVRISCPAEGVFSTITIRVEASDPDGLDDLRIIDRANDIQYQLELSRTGPSRRFTRSFPLSEIFPNVPAEIRVLHLEVLVRNTKGQTATAQATVRLRKKDHAP